MTTPEQANSGDEAARLGRPPLVDFAMLGRRLRRTALWLGGLVALGWLVSLPFNGVDVGLLMNLVGMALAAMFVAEVVIVGGSALRGMMRAGERGERLASEGVGLLPPQLARGRKAAVDAQPPDGGDAGPA